MAAQLIDGKAVAAAVHEHALDGGIRDDARPVADQRACLADVLGALNEDIIRELKLVKYVEPDFPDAARLEGYRGARVLIIGGRQSAFEWAALLAEAGAAVAQARARLVGRLGTALAALPDAPFARPELDYRPGGPLDPAELTAALAAGRRRDRAAQRTLIGPHRDELSVVMAGKDQPAAECSTGEQKAMLIAITLAHAGLLDQARAGVLLLDEVAAHLDPVRREALFDRLRAGSAQVWLTGTELPPFEAILGEAAVWRVSGGLAERQ